MKSFRYFYMMKKSAAFFSLHSRLGYNNGEHFSWIAHTRTHTHTHTCKNTLLLGCWQFFFFVFPLLLHPLNFQFHWGMHYCYCCCCCCSIRGLFLWPLFRTSSTHFIYDRKKSTGNIKIKFLYLQWINEWFPPLCVMVFALHIVSLMYAWSQYLHFT